MTEVPDGLVAHLVVQRDEGFTLDVALTIEPGTTVALLGPNGAGKSTAVDALAGLLPLDDGKITLGGRILDEPASGTFVPPEDRRVGVVFQHYVLFDHLDVVENVAFGPACRGESRQEARTTARRWIGRLDLAGLEERRPGQLSGGQAQRVALARALATEPDLLLLDEPLAALDVATRTNLRRTLAEHLAVYAGPRLLITHDPADAVLLADQIHVMEGGRVTQTGSPDDIRRRPATPYAAALVGTNLLFATNRGGTLTLDGRPHTLETADTRTAGPVLVTIHPAAIALHPDQPHGSPRNAWPTTIDTVEPTGDVVRVTLGDPLPLTADITPTSARTLGLVAGSAVWAAVKATEVAVTPACGAPGPAS